MDMPAPASTPVDGPSKLNSNHHQYHHHPHPASALASSSTNLTPTGGKTKRVARHSPEVDEFAAPPTTAAEASKVRAFAACRTCRQKKIKCLPGPFNAALDPSKGPGPCRQCLQSNVECEYQPTRDRAAYSRAYVQDLSGRVIALEQLQSRLLPLLHAFEGGHIPLPGYGPGPLQSQARASVGVGAGDTDDEQDAEEDDEALPNNNRADQKRTLSSDEIEEDGQMTTDERGNYRWIGSSNTLTLLDSFVGHEARRGREYSHSSYRPRGIVEPGEGGGTGGARNRETPRVPSPENPYFGPVAGSGVVKAMPGIEEVEFPSRRDAEDMVEAFFAEVFPVLPVVLAHDFRRAFADLMDGVDRGDLSGLNGGFLSVVFAIFALGERVIVTSNAWQRERSKLRSGGGDTSDAVLPGEAEAGVIWFERSQILHFTSIREIHIHQVQCLTLLAAFQASVNAMPMSWLLAGQALRIAQDIGLHRSAPRLKMSFALKQLGARCWWAIYGLERMVSITLGRPLGVDDQDIDVAYPAVVDDETMERMFDAQSVDDLPEEPESATMSGFVALTKLCKIAGRVAQVLYRPSNGRSVTDASWTESQQRTIDKLDRLLRDWLEHEVPRKYKDPSPSRKVSLMSAVLSNSYFSVLITLHRNLLPSNPDFPRPKPPPSSQSLAHCVDAARSVIHVAAQSRVLVPVSHHIAVFCQYLWSSAVILLLCEVRAREQLVLDAVGAQVDSCRTSLHALEPVWPGCSKLRELLSDVESRAKEVRAAASAASVAQPQPSRPTKRPKISSTETLGQPRSRTKTASAGASPSRSSTSGGFVPSINGGSRPWQPPHSIIPTRNEQYETSDTRSMLSTVSRHGSGTEGPTYTPLIPATQSAQLAPSSFDPSSIPTFDLFDVGGMTFDGLEMLSAFTSDTGMWNPAFGASEIATGPSSGNGDYAIAPTLVNSQQRPGPVHVQSQHFSLGSHDQTSAPTPATSVSGSNPTAVPSPAGVTAWLSHGLGPPPPPSRPSSASQQQGAVELAEIWSQIAGGSFDWEADPNVPFNI